MNKAEKEWADKISSYGCIVCRRSGIEPPHCCVHHVGVGAGGRRDHAKIIGLCHYHHQGKEGIHTLGRKAWQAKYGTEQELMNEYEILK